VAVCLLGVFAAAHWPRVFTPATETYTIMSMHAEAGEKEEEEEEEAVAATTLKVSPEADANFISLLAFSCKTAF